MQVNGRIIKKRIHVRVEHVTPSRCREDFLARRTKNEELKKKAKAEGGALLQPTACFSMIEELLCVPLHPCVSPR